MSLFLAFNRFRSLRWCSYVDFEQVNASLEIAYKCLPNVQ